ncbi:TPA: MerR family transcriptional regulator, partial [Bacillus anthracis]|nr:MerR family transcriptional regulator [Bacillus anthracis]
MQGTYSITEVAVKLSISVSAVRKYEQDYSLDIMRNEIGHRVYTDSDIDILKRIIELKKEGANIHL